MKSRGVEGQQGPPTASELVEFDRLLTSDSFNEDVYGSRSLIVCSGWLRALEYDVSLWIRSFRMNRSELHQALLDIQKNLKLLFTKLDRLYGGSRSYLAQCPFGIPAETNNLFDEYLVINDDLGDVLEEYLIYANAYRAQYEEKELLSTTPLSRKPGEIRKDLFGKLDLLQEVLANLADSLSDLPAGPADLAGSGPPKPLRHARQAPGQRPVKDQREG